jgi:hypothetical protein
MSSHINYYILVYNLIRFKEEFYRISDKKYQPIINELANYAIISNDYEEEFPNNKELAVKLSFSQPKMNRLLKELYDELISTFSRQPLKIRKSLCQIYIHFSFEEEEAMDRKRREYFSNKSTWIQAELPFIPRIGEEIRWDFLAESGKFYHGYIHNVEHEIDGVKQNIFIDVHPLDNVYFRWQKLKENWEYEQRRERARSWRIQ